MYPVMGTDNRKVSFHNQSSANSKNIKPLEQLAEVKGTLRRRLSHGYFSFIAKYTSN